MKLNKFIRLYFQTANICTNRCRFCNYKDSGPLPNGKPETMSVSDFNICLSKIHDYLQENNIILKIFCPYNSNEPFADESFIQKLESFYKIFPYTRMEIASNATLLTPKITDSFLNILTNNMADCKHDIYFNLPGVDKKTFKRNSDMSFDKTISNILYFIETNDNKINVHIKTELDDNCGYKEKDIIGFWKSLDIEKNKKKQVQFELMFPSDRAGNLKGEFDLKIYMAKIFGCNFRVLLDNLYIIQNGDVVTCCNDWYNNMTLGNLLKSNLSDIINSDKYWTFFKWIYGIEEAPQNFICRRCYNSIGFGSRPKEFIGGKKYGGD